jgi:hypothetical protein
MCDEVTLAVPIEGKITTTTHACYCKLLLSWLPDPPSKFIPAMPRGALNCRNIPSVSVFCLVLIDGLMISLLLCPNPSPT